jgi:hypothetical protein
MLTVRDHPDWTDGRVAKEVGCAGSTLSRSAQYQRAAAVARGTTDSVTRGHMVRNRDGTNEQAEGRVYDAEPNF